MLNFTGERVVPDQMAGDITTLRQHLTRYVWALQFCNNKKILDAACGSGYGLEIMSMVAKEVFGIDNEKEVLNYAEKNYKMFEKCGFLWWLDLEEDDFSDNKRMGKLDVITSFETIEHLENPEFFLENVKKALADNGSFIFSIPNTNLSKFHKKVYDFYGAQALIENIFPIVRWHGQNNCNIDEISNDSQFFLGVAMK